METEIRFEKTEAAIAAFLQDFVSTYKGLLIRDGKKASGNLINSIREYSIELSGNGIEGSIELASYWKYVEYGRKPGKWPPRDKILEWIKIKPVLPRPVNGLKPPTQEQMAFLICRKIGKDGIEPGNQFSEALDIVWQRKKQEIESAVSKDLQAAVDLIRI